MATPFLGEIKIVSFNFPPKGWAFCNGQLLQINQNQALFAILGTTYGGNGTTTFGLPNLQTKSPIHTGQGFSLGQTGGEQNHTLILSELAAHTHPAIGSSNAADQSNPAGNFWATGQTIYSTAANSTMAPQAVTNTGGGQAHNNMSPYLVLNFIIALQGIFPSRN
jgi:microcystin-dependent protein